MDKYDLSCILFFFFTERGDGFDWEALLDEEAIKRRITVNEHLPGMNKIL